MKKLLLGFLAGTLLAWCGSGVFAQEKIDKAELPEIQRKAETGDKEALNDLGACYYEGIGVKKDVKKGFEFFQKAAEKGYSKAYYNCALCYYNGEGVEQNKSRAVQMLEKAAKADDVTAASFLGACYLLGDGVEKDVFKGFEWSKKAAEKGDARAAYNLGCCYEDGIGVEKDVTLAEKWYTKAAKEGFKKAEEALQQLKAPAKEPKLCTKAEEIPAGYQKTGSTEIKRSSKSVSFSVGKKDQESGEKKLTLREELLQEARKEKAEFVLILKEQGNADNGCISAEFYQKK